MSLENNGVIIPVTKDISVAVNSFCAEIDDLNIMIMPKLRKSHYYDISIIICECEVDINYFAVNSAESIIWYFKYIKDGRYYDKGCYIPSLIKSLSIEIENNIAYIMISKKPFKRIGIAIVDMITIFETISKVTKVMNKGIDDFIEDTIKEGNCISKPLILKNTNEVIIDESMDSSSDNKIYLEVISDDDVYVSLFTYMFKIYGVEDIYIDPNKTSIITMRTFKYTRDTDEEDILIKPFIEIINGTKYIDLSKFQDKISFKIYKYDTSRLSQVVTDECYKNLVTHFGTK